MNVRKKSVKQIGIGEWIYTKHGHRRFFEEVIHIRDHGSCIVLYTTTDKYYVPSCCSLLTKTP